jgi:hypothetical protein
MRFPTCELINYCSDHFASWITTCMQIKDRLLIEDKRIEAFELRKNKDNNRKYNKQVQELRKSEGAAQRKKQISDVSNLRKESAADGQSKEDKVKQLIDGEPLTKSKKRVNMVRRCVIGMRCTLWCQACAF